MDSYRPAKADPADTAAIFQPFAIGSLQLKNRLLRSSISGRIDNYDGSGALARINFDERFARGGVAAIISSHVPITPSARVLPNYAMIDRDERIPFWQSVGAAHPATWLQIYPPAVALGPAAGYRRRGKYRPTTRRRNRPAGLLQRLALPAHVRSGNRRSRRAFRGSGGTRAQGRSGWHRAALGQRLLVYPVPEFGDQRSQRSLRRQPGEPRALSHGSDRRDPKTRRPRLSADRQS